MTFAKSVQVMRLIRGMKQQDLADAAGVNRSVIWQVEAGAMLPGEAVEVAIKAALRWPVDAELAFRILEQ